jgi:carboxylesterase
MRARILHAMTNAASSNAGLFATPSQALREMWGLVRDVKPSLSRVRQDVLLIQAREDDVASLSNAFYLQKHLGGRVESVILDDCYHLITLDRQRGDVSRRVCAFVQSLEQELALNPRHIDIRLPNAQ